MYKHISNNIILEEKSIASISVVRLTSPTPSMVDQEETERLEELERFLEAATDREESDTDNDSQSGGDELISEKDHVTGDDNDNTGCENNGDSTETEAEVPKVKKRPGRKPKAPKKQKKRRKPKERPQIVGLSVEQFYAESSADLVVKNALSMSFNIELLAKLMYIYKNCRVGWFIYIQAHAGNRCFVRDYSKRSQLHSIHVARTNESTEDSRKNGFGTANSPRTQIHRSHPIQCENVER